MNLEQIDTSTTAGKAEVMRLAAEGRRVAVKGKGPYDPQGWVVCHREIWDWLRADYAIIAEPVGPEEVWVNEFNGTFYASPDREIADRFSSTGTAVRYIRADLAGEGK